MGRLIAWPLGIVGIILIILASFGIINAAINVILDFCIPMIVLSVITIFVPD